ncbi:MAG: YdcF family protein [Ruminococcus sp.]|nr:YdcF family protein [Ruminococcus sp.]MCD7801167.1 YdcF family protein [Ruminococcus sp.]
MISLLTHIESTPLRVCFCIIFLALIFLFISPMFLEVINLGNIVGTIVSILGFLIFTFNNRFTIIIEKIKENSVGKVTVSIVSILIILCMLLAVIISVAMVYKMNNYPSEPSNIIVLGCKVKGTQPSLMLKRRLDTAYEYLIENPETIAIVSGGQGSDEQISEAQCMKEYLVNKGISESRVIMEDKSTSTYENFKYSKQILEELSLPTDSITVVTDGYHQLRASMIAKKLDFKTYSISANTSWYLVPTYFVREWFGVTYQYVFG